MTDNEASLAIADGARLAAFASRGGYAGMLQILVAAGPIFTIGRWAGDERTRRMGQWLLTLIPRWMSMFGFLMSRLAQVVLLAIVLSLIPAAFGAIARLAGALPAIVAALILLVLFVLYLYGLIKFLGWHYRQLRARIRLFCQESRKRFDAPPLWPLRSLENQQRLRGVILFEGALFLLALLYGIAFPVLWALVALGWSLLWAATRLRAALGFEHRYQLEIFAYALSAGAAWFTWLR